MCVKLNPNFFHHHKLKTSGVIKHIGTTVFSRLRIRKQSDPAEIQSLETEKSLLCKTSQMCAGYLSSCVCDSLWHVSILTPL